MLVRRLKQAKFLKDLRYVCLNRALRQEEMASDGSVRHPLCNESQNLPLALGQSGEWVLSTTSPNQLGDDRWVYDSLALHDPAQRIHYRRYVENAVLQEISDAFRIRLDELHRVSGLDVLREDQHAYVRILGPNLAGCDQPFVRVRRRHPDVDDRYVWMQRADLFHQLGGVSALSHHLDAGLTQEPHDARSGQHRVVGDHHSRSGEVIWHGRHHYSLGSISELTRPTGICRLGSVMKAARRAFRLCRYSAQGRPCRPAHRLDQRARPYATCVRNH